MIAPLHAGQVSAAGGSPLAARCLERVMTTAPGVAILRRVDGSPLAARCLERVMTTAPGPGILRYVDGSPLAARCLERVMTTRPGILRHVDAVYPEVKRFTESAGLEAPMEE